MGCKYYLEFIGYLFDELGSGKNTNFTMGKGLVLMALCMLVLLAVSFILLIFSIVLTFKEIKAKKAKADSIICPNCGAVYTTAQAHCSQCGANMNQNIVQDTEQDTANEWKCSKCDTLNPSDSKFCKNCGNSK
jgi:ribosomal protein L40E